MLKRVNISKLAEVSISHFTFHPSLRNKSHLKNPFSNINFYEHDNNPTKIPLPTTIKSLPLHLSAPSKVLIFFTSPIALLKKHFAWFERLSRVHSRAFSICYTLIKETTGECRVKTVEKRKQKASEQETGREEKQTFVNTRKLINQMMAERCRIS